MARRTTPRKTKELNAVDPGRGTGNGLPKEQRPIKPPPPPAMRDPVRDPVVVSIEGQRSWISNVAGMLANSSVAYRMDPVYQQMMLRDPGICSSLDAVCLPIASAEWEIEPEDETDAEMVACADVLTDIFSRIPQRTEMIRILAMGKWWGSSCINYMIRPDPFTRWAVSRWVPLHPDALAFDIYGNLAMRVGSAYTTKMSVTDIGLSSLVHIFDDAERLSLIHCRFGAEAPNFDDAQSADQVWRGVGDRDRVWFYWYFQQEVMQQGGMWCRRYSGGVRKGRYRQGDTAQQEAVASVMSNMMNDNNILLPRVPGEEPDVCDIEIMEPPASKATMFIDLMNFTRARIKEEIEGQSLTSESNPGGIGGGNSDKHADTKSLRIRYTADRVAESITTDFLRPMAMRLGYSEKAMRGVSLRLVTERPNPKERAEAAKALYDMGVPLSERELREVCGGFSAPKDGEPIVVRPSPDPLAGILGADQRSEIAA